WARQIAWPTLPRLPRSALFPFLLDRRPRPEGRTKISSKFQWKPSINGYSWKASATLCKGVVMQVSNLYLRNVKVGQTEPGGPANPVPAQSAGAANPVPASSTYVSSAEFQQLLNLAAQEPEVRED